MLNQLNKTLIDKEKKIQLATIKSSGKPDTIVEKILDGKMKKFYSEVILLNQPYILDNDKDIQKSAFKTQTCVAVLFNFYNK